MCIYMYVCVCMYIYIFWPHRVACGILVPRPGIKPIPPALGAWSPNHWTTREVPMKYILKIIACWEFPEVT